MCLVHSMQRRLQLDEQNHAAFWYVSSVVAIIIRRVHVNLAFRLWFAKCKCCRELFSKLCVLVKHNCLRHL